MSGSMGKGVIREQEGVLVGEKKKKMIDQI